MKEVEFSGELPDMDVLKAALFGDPSDPKSPNYVRQLERPDINWLLVAAGIILPLLAAFAVAFFMYVAKVRLIYCILAVVAVLALCGILLARRAVITAVKIYQRFAPKSIREKCRFEPSCSQYMILAIEKYGLIRGVMKGIDRLRRCNVHGGGFDMP